jgi:26S proteasome regulatory subunit N2
MNIVTNLEFRIEILRLLVSLYHDLSEPDYDSVCQCFIHLNDSAACAGMLKDLVAKDEVCVALSNIKQHRLVAMQISFDLEDNATQEFLNKVTSFTLISF